MELGFEFGPVTFGVGSAPGVNAVGSRDMGAKTVLCNCAPMLGAPGANGAGC